ncbi:MAG: phenylacetate--CoA ligase family protein [Hyphomicrobium sp.]
MWSNIYFKLPVSLQNAACSLVGLRLKRFRYNSEFWKLLHQLERNGQLDDAGLVQLRDRRLEEVVRHAATTVPHYQRLFAELGIRPTDVRSLSDIAKLPILNKVEVQRSTESFFSSAVPRSERKWVHTSGTTGAGLDFVTTPTAVREHYAVWWRYLRWHGIPFGTWCAYFGGRYIVPSEQTYPPYWRENIFGKQLLFSAFHTTPENLEHTVRKLREARPPWLHGYPSHLTIIATHILETGFDLGYRPQWITTCSESVLAHHSSAIRAAFGVAPLQHYAMAEAAANISECPAGNLHVDEDFAAVEFIPLGEDGLHRVVGTNLSNLATPLLRYATGDLVRLSSTPCSCGRHGRIVVSIEGRAEDNVELPNGARICRFDHVFRGQVNIRAAQIHQSEVGAIDVLIVKGERYSREDEANILDGFRLRVGKNTDVRLHYVDEVQRAASGKTRFVISDVRRKRSTCSSGQSVANSMS